MKERYFYLDSTPTHSYMKFLYKYPQQEFPYLQLIEGHRRRGRGEPEFELLDTGIFDDHRYFDVVVEYAKADVEDILIKATIVNRGPEPANLRVLPTIWFRNIWSCDDTDARPSLRALRSLPDPIVELSCTALGKRWLYCEGEPELLFTENETNYRRLFGIENRTVQVKDGINDYVVGGAATVNPEHIGTKAAAHYRLAIQPGAGGVVRMRLSDSEFQRSNAFTDFEEVFEQRKHEAYEFYASVIPPDISADARNVMRQGFAGMLWSKQFYHYVVKEWLEG